ncbi:hypothetical protein [Lachnoclostridium sp. An118]|uniref:hypothetical protein n=1 Tax=Lachnoclostridium sp. An118 TaxID=1965547 RepID=UPI0013DE14DB|nr:hypothetical protein [Lachnoclostridium sp. An118]HJA42934.1 hypothetical protein [Candidatus Dorea stercoravium]
MKRVAGFALFWLAVGVLISIWLPNLFVEVLCIILCLLAAYELFFCCRDDK